MSASDPKGEVAGYSMTSVRECKHRGRDVEAKQSRAAIRVSHLGNTSSKM